MATTTTSSLGTSRRARTLNRKRLSSAPRRRGRRRRGAGIRVTARVTPRVLPTGQLSPPGLSLVHVARGRTARHLSHPCGSPVRTRSTASCSLGRPRMLSWLSVSSKKDWWNAATTTNSRRAEPPIRKRKRSAPRGRDRRWRGAGVYVRAWVTPRGLLTGQLSTPGLSRRLRRVARGRTARDPILHPGVAPGRTLSTATCLPGHLRMPPWSSVSFKKDWRSTAPFSLGTSRRRALDASRLRSKPRGSVRKIYGRRR
ncbi:uncharacterized protein B0H18DRAFT_676678 [Fomitopsis serialis]|uniref:uncharacterized protein n=1 Tax=Fomitopsis serialis TaxID=139415 RepID=UPI0020072E5D|nr:uncharacterized protein B0H18DRAFT_676678 [Neoantrodia serialis]KAH9918309.1 hypothetical protein B0H18DRAFT_676678 [Neoantrodia serialis]